MKEYDGHTLLGCQCGAAYHPLVDTRARMAPVSNIGPGDAVRGCTRHGHVCVTKLGCKVVVSCGQLSRG